jgi:hypothetical protein
MKEVNFKFNTEAVKPQEEYEKMAPEKTLEYVSKIGKDFTQYAIEVEAMLEEAKERGINADLSSNETIKKFEPLGEYELVLVKLRSELLNLKAELFKQGVKMTREDMDERLKKMDQK